MRILTKDGEQGTREQCSVPCSPLFACQADFFASGGAISEVELSFVSGEALARLFAQVVHP